MLWLHAQVLRCDLIDVRLLQFSKYSVVRVLARIGPVRIPLICSVLRCREIGGGRMGGVLDGDDIGSDVASWWRRSRSAYETLMFGRRHLPVGYRSS